LRPMELALFVKRQLEAGQSQADVARALGKSRGYVTCVCALIDPPDWLMDAYRNGKCRGITELYDLRRTHAEHPQAVTRLRSESEVVSRSDIARLREQLASSPVAPQPATPATAGPDDDQDAQSSPEGALPLQARRNDQRPIVNRRQGVLVLLGE